MGTRHWLLHSCWTTLGTLSHFPENCRRILVTFVWTFHYVSRHYFSFMLLIMFNTKSFLNFPASTRTTCLSFIEHCSLLVYLYECLVGACMRACLAVCSRCMCMSDRIVFLCVWVQIWCSGSATEFCIKISASQKKRKARIFIFFQKGLPFFSLVNSLNEIYKYEYIL